MTNNHNSIAVFSPTGGIGVSILSAYLAWCLAKQDECCIIDCNFELGSIGDYLNCSPSIGGSAINSLQIGFNEKLRNKLRHPRRQNLSVITFSDGAKNNPIEIIELLESGTSDFKYTIIDLPHDPQPLAISQTFSLVNHIFLLTQYNWSAIVNARNFMDGLPEEICKKILLVVNKNEWLPQDVLHECRLNLKKPIFHEIPYDRKSRMEHSRLVDLNSHFSKAIMKLAKKYTDLIVCDL